MTLNHTESHRYDAYVNYTLEGENVLEIVPDNRIVTVSIVALNGSFLLTKTCAGFYGGSL
jgi:hypothetical protein